MYYLSWETLTDGEWVKYADWYKVGHENAIDEMLYRAMTEWANIVRNMRLGFVS